LESAITVLLQNSRQAGAAHAVIGARASLAQVVLSVTDDGPGVPPADRERLFEPFFTSRREAGGTGLGLPIARSLLAASWAAIALVPSTEGTRFEIVLPRAGRGR
jgi:signal transduction histidine kinase